MINKEIAMNNGDLENYCRRAVENGATHARQIHPNTVITEPMGKEEMSIWVYYL